VLVRSTDGTRSWDTVGVHPNVVEASWMALSDAYTYAMILRRQAGRALSRMRIVGVG
jgi:hypothetical protein